MFHELEKSSISEGRDVLKLHAGDAITGTTYFTLFEGDADAKLMNHICFDAFAPGNHGESSSSSICSFVCFSHKYTHTERVLLYIYYTKTQLLYCLY